MDEQKKRGRPAADKDDKKTLGKLRERWDGAKQYYNREWRKLRILDRTDRGELWKAIKATYPKYQILPDTNWVAYIKQNILASIYSVAKGAEIIATSDADKELCTQLNIALDCIWDTQDVGYYQFKAGERAALCNLGLTQVGWDENVTQGSGHNIQKGKITFKNISPMKFMRDPYAEEFDDSEWMCTFDNYHISILMQNPDYKKAIKEWKEKNNNPEHEIGNVLGDVYKGPNAISKSNAKDYYTLVIWWVRNEDGGIDELHTLNNEVLLHKRENIKPNMFPIAPLYCNEPAGALIGTSECSKIFANNVAYNMMDSMALTAEYKNQHPPRFVSDQSKLNVQAFAKFGTEADKTFVVAGDASKAIHYHQFPEVSNFLPTLKMSLEQGIQAVSGIDGRYTGRDTGSIITTGGTEEMLNRVTLIDTPKILMYEKYCKRLTELVLGNMIEFAPKRKFFRQRPGKPSEWETVEVDFPNINSDTLFNYRIAISSELPKNKQRMAAMATELLQAQAQYRKDGDNVNWITEEEWLEFQDLPFKERMLERMGIQRRENAMEEVAQVLYQYAGLAQQGMPPEQAMAQTADTLMQTRQGIPITPETMQTPTPMESPEL